MAAAEQKKAYQVVKNFKGVNTQANRTAIDADQFAWLENIQPIGFGNLKALGTQSANLFTWSGTPSACYSCNIKNVDYIIAFFTNGGAQYYRVDTGATGTVAAASKFSASGVRIAQWKTDRILICDTVKGLFNWDGTNVVSIGSISGYGIVNRGTAYTSPPSVAIGAPNETGGVQAVAQAIMTANGVSGLLFTEAGSGYTSPPTVTFTGGGGTNANAVVSTLSFAKGTVGAYVLSGGTGYAAAPTVTITGGGGTNAAATAIVSGNAVVGLVFSNNGINYTSPPTIAFSTGAAIATAVATTDNSPAVSTFSGRVWVAQGRSVYYSAAGSYNDFVSVSAGNINIQDETLHNNITAMLSANNFLYVFGDSSINVFSDVRVQTNGTTIFTNTNVTASVGSKREMTIFPYFRSVLFMNDYGIYALVGSTTTKLSNELDAIFPLIDFTQPVTGGQVLINNILCAAWSFTYNDQTLVPAANRQIQAVFFDKRWFFTSQGALTYVTSIPASGVISLYGTTSTGLFKLYSSATTGANVLIRSALWPMNDPIRDKQALKAAIEVTTTSVGTFGVNIDSELKSSPTSIGIAFVAWTNVFGTQIPWTNNSSAVIPWFNNGYTLYKSDAQQYGKYLGLTITASSSLFTLNTLELEYELRARF
jgi:hypothetical protein